MVNLAQYFNLRLNVFICRSLHYFDIACLHCDSTLSWHWLQQPRLWNPHHCTVESSVDNLCTLWFAHLPIINLLPLYTSSLVLLVIVQVSLWDNLHVYSIPYRHSSHFPEYFGFRSWPKAREQRSHQQVALWIFPSKLIYLCLIVLSFIPLDENQ